MAGAIPKYRRFLLVLQDVTETTNKQLAQMVGKKEANISDYLSGKKAVGKKAIVSAVRHLAEWSVVPDLTMISVDDKGTITTKPGIFFIYDSAGNCVYLGQGSNLRVEVSQRLTTKILRHGIWRDPKLKLTRYPIKEVAAYITTFHVESARLRHNLEALFLHTVINQTQNSKKGAFR